MWSKAAAPRSLRLPSCRSSDFPWRFIRSSGFLSVAKALEQVYGEIKALKGTVASEREMYSFAKMCELMGFAQVWEFDRTHAE